MSERCGIVASVGAAEAWKGPGACYAQGAWAPCLDADPPRPPAPRQCPRFHALYRRHNYTTPKSYLELISLYKALLARKREELRSAKERLENGGSGGGQGGGWWSWVAGREGVES